MREEDRFIFENLEVYQRSVRLSVKVCGLASRFSVIYSRIRDQFIGAIISIPLNVAEGSGRLSVKDKINFYKIARSSSFECIPITDICFSLNLIDNELRTNIRRELREISSMLSGLINYNRNK